MDRRAVLLEALGSVALVWPFGRKPKLQEPSWLGSWAVLEREHDENALVARVRLGVGRLAHDGTFGHRIRIAIPLNRPMDVGFPAKDERAELAAIEEAIIKLFEADRRSMLVLSITTNGVKEYVLYTKNPEGAKDKFDQLTRGVTTHELELLVEPDADWSVYKEFVA